MSIVTTARAVPKLSPGNSKIGKVLNVSLPPVVSCAAGIPCARLCYARKAFRNYPTAREAWEHNWELLQSDRDAFFAGIADRIDEEQPAMFRWWTSGDTPDADCLRRQFALARMFPRVRFLQFTKNHDLDFRGRPHNFALVLSMWPGWGNTRKRLPRAWLDDGTDTRIPHDAIACSGKCDTCGLCWDLAKLGRDVVFAKH